MKEENSKEWLRPLKGNNEWHHIPHVFDDEDASLLSICTFAEGGGDTLLPMVLKVQDGVKTVLKCPHIFEDGTCGFLSEGQVCPNNTQASPVQPMNGSFERQVVSTPVVNPLPTLTIRRIPKGEIKEPFSNFRFSSLEHLWMYEDGFEFENIKLPIGGFLSPEYLKSKNVQWIGVQQESVDDFVRIDGVNIRYKTVALSEGQCVLFEVDSIESEKGINIGRKGDSYAVVCLISKKEQIDLDLNTPVCIQNKGV